MLSRSKRNGQYNDILSTIKGLTHSQKATIVDMSPEVELGEDTTTHEEE